ncbi:Gfo/Idh/MocA family oxidoreductase [Reinekea forsetii]|nr:Gfo/Idh/MocA family oxidoreductase [Reinekea forsetii]
MTTWGVAGTGGMASLFLDDASKLTSGHFNAVYSGSLSRATAFAQQHKLDHAYDDYNAFVENPDLDVIYIAGVHTTHADLAIRALQAKKHVLIEKPMTLNVTQAQQIIDAAKKANRFCAEALWTRFTPTLESVISDISSGKIGEIRHISASFGFRVDLDDHQQRLLNPQLAGGALLDIGLYPLLLPLFLLGQPTEIKANVEFSESQVDLASDLILTYPQGVSAQLSYRLDAYLPNKAFIAGTKGYVELEAPWFASNRADWCMADQPIESQYFALTNRGWGYEFDEVNGCIAAGLLESSKHSWQDALSLATLLERIRSEYGPIYPFEQP